MKLQRLTNEDFELLAGETQLGKDAREMAHRLLVLGESASDIARDMKVTRQRVSIAADAIRRQYHQRGLKTGLMSVAVGVPHVLHAQVEVFTQADLDATEGREDAVDSVSKSLLQGCRRLQSAKGSKTSN